MAAAGTSQDINAEIVAFGPSLFEAVRAAVRDKATIPPRTQPGSAAHRENQRKLEAKIDELLAQTHHDRARDLGDNELWSILWGRIVYSGTRARKASNEIASMRDVSFFADHKIFDANRHQFDKGEWRLFRKQWQKRKKDAHARGHWLDWAKSQGPLWAGSLVQGFKRTTPEILELMTHSGRYADLSFSAHEDKMEKYLDVAAFLNSPKAKAHPRIIEHYTAGAVFGRLHPQGEEYIRESALRRQVQRLFAAQLGPISALHVMMDLGMRTVKPDRVITWLFSQLGWLRTLPATLDKETVMAVYTHPRVVEEVLARTDVLAAVIATDESPHTHRLVDIWFVKYGQEPEHDYGIEVNLQASEPGGIRGLYDAVRTRLAEASIDPDDARRRWPMGDFEPLAIDEGRAKGGSSKAVKARAPRRSKRVVPRKEAEDLFMVQWRRGRESNPELYPEGLDNDPKEAIIDLIERGWDTEEAFLTILRPEALEDENEDEEDGDE